jgi:hypothetical protein
MNIGNSKDEHIFNALNENISNVITTKVYGNQIDTSIRERVDVLIYDEMELQISLIMYTLPWN